MRALTTGTQAEATKFVSSAWGLLPLWVSLQARVAFASFPLACSPIHSPMTMVVHERIAFSKGGKRFHHRSGSVALVVSLGTLHGKRLGWGPKLTSRPLLCRIEGADRRRLGKRRLLLDVLTTSLFTLNSVQKRKD